MGNRLNGKWQDMVNRNLLRGLDQGEQDWEDNLTTALEGVEASEIDWGGSDIRFNNIIEGKVLRIKDGFVLVDVGFKCEGTIPLSEWDETEEPPAVGSTVRVLLEESEEAPAGTPETNLISLSKRKAERIESWLKVMETVHEGDVVTGTVTRQVKGGLLVDIGVSAFLPASQIDIRRTADVRDFIGRSVQCVVLQIEEARHNILVSRRALIENERAEKKTKLLAELEVGQVRKGVVKNLASFGAFVDLGGMDGLLHVSDMSWGRISHPSEMVQIDQELEVQVLHIDREKEKIALGLKQLTASPWDSVIEKYPVASRHKGSVVNVMSYGAFVKLEEGVEGLVHISEMSWTKRITDPSEVVHTGDEIEVVVLGINREKHEISLGMKQAQENPWDKTVESYPPGTLVTGTVRNLTNYGAFVEIAAGIDGLLHVSDMSWTRKIGHPSEVVEKGQTLECQVLSVDASRRRIALGLKQLQKDPWTEIIPHKYQPGTVVKGTVTKITNFGVFVGLEDSLDGLVHISELAEHQVDDPAEVVNIGDEIEVRILRVDSEERKIALSRRQVTSPEPLEEVESAASAPTPARPRERELKGGVGGGAGPLFNPVEKEG